MDPVSTLSLMMPALRILTFSFTTAKQVWEAPGELQELSSELLQLDTLANILRSLVEAQGEGSSSIRALEPAITRLSNARKVFEERLSRTHKRNSAESRFRRRTWMRYHGEIKKVMRDVVVVRKDLTAVMLLLNLSSVNTLQIQQTNLLRLVNAPQSQLGSVRGALPAPEGSQNLDQALLALTQSRAQSDRPPSTNEHCEQLAEIDDFLDAVSQYSEEVSEALPFLTPENRSLIDCPFETPRHFFPERYVMAGPAYERLAIHLTKEFNRTATARIDEYYLLFAKDSRHWNRVTVTATTAKEEFKLSEVASSSSPAPFLTLPGLVRPQLEAMLDAIDLYSSVTNISIQLETNDEGYITFDPMKANVVQDSREMSIRNTQKDIEEIEHQGLPQYLESEVVVLTRLGAHRYIVLVESQLCIEQIFPFTELAVPGRRPITTFLADMRLLLMAQGCLGVARFVGVVLSDDRRQIRSYLTQYRGQCSIARIMRDQSSKTKSIPWKRRERWIRQAITLVAEVHRRGIILGFVSIDWVELDSDDSISYRIFTLKGNHIRNQGGYLPPEMRRHTEYLAYAHGQELTFMCDIFQLGLFVWMIAQQIPLAFGNSGFCELDRCPTVPRYRCTADHANPIQLPTCNNSDVPGYIETIIRYCRQEQPSRRKSAAALLDLLPPDEGQHNFTMDAGTLSALQDSSLESRLESTMCDECGLDVSGEHYHCNFCHEGDFDLCPKCVSSGITCLDSGHRLSHRILKNGRLIIEPSRNASTR